MSKIASILLLGCTAYTLNASVVAADNTKVYIYEKPSLKSKQIGSLKTKYLNLSKVQEETFIRGEEYLWYRIDSGWVYASWAINDSKRPIPYNNDPFHKKRVDKAVALPVVATTASMQRDRSALGDGEEKELAGKEPHKISARKEEHTPKDHSTNKVQSYDTKYFIGTSLNYNMLTVDKEDQRGSIVLNNMPDDSATSIELEAGMKMDNYVVSANYEMVNLSDVSLNSFYLSLDYQFENLFNPFIGLSLGMSNLEWQMDPLGNSINKDTKLSSLLYGIQVGVEYKLIKHWSVTSSLAYHKLNFTTKLISSPAHSELLHKDKSSLGVGVRYEF